MAETADSSLPSSRLPSGPFPVVGMVHLLPLPGAPGWGGSMDEVLDRAARDASALVEGGVDGLLVENYGDVPFQPGPVPPETTAAMTRCVARVAETGGGRPVGVNVLRNDARAALGIAAATGAAFIRVNVHVGLMVTDQGPLEGRAWETLRLRRAWAPGVAVVADVHVKHAVPPPGWSVEEAARDTVDRGLADVVVVSGAGTGRSPGPGRLDAVRRAVPETPVWLGSGLDAGGVASLLARAHGAIVGSALQAGGRAGAGVEAARVRAFMEAVEALRRRHPGGPPPPGAG